MKDLNKESEFNPTATRLLTLLNVSATKKRQQDVFVPAEKLNKRQVWATTTEEPVELPDAPAAEESPAPDSDGPKAQPGADDVEDDDEDDSAKSTSYARHFGPTPAAFSESSKRDVDQKAWKTSQISCANLGKLMGMIPANSSASVEPGSADLLEKLKKPFDSRRANQSSGKTMLQNDVLALLSTYRDLYLSSLPLNQKRCTREAISLHFLNHIHRKRRRVIKNNERLAHAAKAQADSAPPQDVQDQGFTRPSVLVLLPFRSAALDWFRAITSHTPSPEYQVENASRFIEEYSLPQGATDKLLSADPGTYPPDHVDMFKGNVDDDFRIGIKMNRKNLKMFADFYSCDIIIASPLGLKRSIDKEKNADYLSSIEILVMDQIDALLMQNWGHTKTVLAHMNQIPKEPRDTDFSRVKPWYLDGYAGYLRQSILLAPFETPEARSVFHSLLKNVEGKYALEKRWMPVDVPEGIEQNFSFFNCSRPTDEPEKRFHHFTVAVLPAVLKSAVQSSNTVVFIPSSFDFIRVQNYLKKEAGLSFAVLSEYSSNQDISRARQAFFSGTKSFLLISERFHFFRRYKIRGIRNVIFYGPPDHPQFYTELLSYPFLDDGVLPSDVSCRVLYSQYDWYKLERIAGTKGALELVKGES